MSEGHMCCLRISFSSCVLSFVGCTSYWGLFHQYWVFCQMLAFFLLLILAFSLFCYTHQFRVLGCFPFSGCLLAWDLWQDRVVHSFSFVHKRVFLFSAVHNFWAVGWFWQFTSFSWIWLYSIMFHSDCSQFFNTGPWNNQNKAVRTHL